MPTASPLWAPVRHRQTLDTEGLRQQAADALMASRRTHADVAEELEVSRGAVTRAVNPNELEPWKFSDLQRRIIALLTDYHVEPEPVTYRVLRKDREADA